VTVVSMMVGAPTPDGATFVTKVTGGPVRVAVAEDDGMTSPVFTSSQAVNAQGVAKVSITGLDPDTRYFWQVEDNSVIDAAVTGQLLTLPAVGQAASFTIGAIADAGLSPVTPGTGATLDNNLISNHAAFNAVRQAALAGNWPLLANLGDWGYPDWGTVLTDTLANRRTFWDDNLLQSNQAALFRDVATLLLWDDHDFAGNNSNGTYANKANALTVYGERCPHYPLDGSNGIYQSRQIGRALVVGSDVRYNRDPNGDTDDATKTMLGSAQKTWMESLLSAAADTDIKLLIWLMPQQWLGTTTDSWASYTTERAELVEMFGNHGFLGRTAILSADYHGLALDDGRNSAGSIPVLQCAAIDATPGAGGGGTYSHGAFDGRNQHGRLTVTDLGNSISVRLAGWRGTEEIVSHQFGFIVSSAATVASGALLRTLTGSYTPVIEARVVTGHPTGDDPDGDEIKTVPGGDVTYDANAEIRASMSLDVLGINERNGLSAFPRFTSDQLAPYGAEIFLRYGLDLGGGGIVWTPLGYFRIEEPSQASAPYGAINVTGKDRMAGIIEADLLAPRTYPDTATLGFVAQDLILEVFPNAVIVWDDDADQDLLGRVLVVEDKRYAALKDVADSRGKLFYVDDEGAFRFETAPDESTPLWEAHAGRGGVLLDASRRLSRIGIYNAVIATGSAADDQEPVRVVVVDNNPQSPTYFHGAFGKVPRRYESPLITTTDQVTSAAISILRRSLGAPIQVEYGMVPNPTLRPWQPVRGQLRDGNRDIVTMQRVRIPLSREKMTGSARSQMLASIGSLT
jgi:Domain of unknown function (DUF5047)/PhoD-like phosphatase